MKPHSHEPDLGKASIYLKAVVICSCCNYKQEVIVGKDKAVYHECNQRNKKILVPTTLGEILNKK